MGDAGRKENLWCRRKVDDLPRKPETTEKEARHFETDPWGSSGVCQTSGGGCPKKKVLYAVLKGYWFKWIPKVIDVIT